MRKLIPVVLIAASGSLLAAQPSQYKFALTVKVGDAEPVSINASLPPGTTHRLQATQALKFDIEVPAPQGPVQATIVKLIDEASGTPFVLATTWIGGPVTLERVSMYTVCGDRVIHLGPAASQPAGCEVLLPMATPDPVFGQCGDCAGPYEGMPASIAARARIAPADEPGEPMVVTGRVLGADGKPRRDIIVYAYHTDAHGIYPEPKTPRSTQSNHHGRLRGWALTDARGRYTFETIRPASYPGTDQPAHIHMHVIERGCGTYFIDELLFTDDPFLTPRMRQELSHGFGGSGITTPERAGAGRTWQVVRDIELGRNIPDYPGCPERALAGTR